ncbi:MAG: pirin family protein [Negativicutes bacterium]|nr:pirin family protein [Negativicutes bacterium]MDR3592811.1 pirin family protein [Negativicutes bacterium]
MTAKRIDRILQAKPTMEGAGVRLKRAFGYEEVPLFDPFLMLDDFHSSQPADYLAGFPWHPHRGIETITYLLEGLVEHGDSMGNKGAIGAGDVQWMTAGSGIIHQEMPQLSPTGTMWGFQLWANLPAASKMMPPRYQDVKAAEIPEVTLAGGTKVKIIAGGIGEVSGPVKDIVIEPEFFDVTIPAGGTFEHRVKAGHTVFAYVLAGEGRFGEADLSLSGSESIVLFGREGEEVIATASEQPFRFLLLAGRPLGEPIAWRGPIVMNSEAELKTAFEEYRLGTFIKDGNGVS